MLSYRLALAPIAVVAVASYTSACVSRRTLAPAPTLELQGSVIAAMNAKPLTGALVRLLCVTSAGTQLVAGTLTDEHGEFWLTIPVPRADCKKVSLWANYVGREGGQAQPPQLRLEPGCQRFEFRLGPDALASLGITQPLTTACRDRWPPPARP
jgi:hypothetical protein